MSRCLRDRTLLALVAGEETAHHRAHLTSCQACSTRYQRFVRNLHAIERVLLTTAPPVATPVDRVRPSVWWAPVAVALTAVLILSWGGFWQSAFLPAPTPRRTVQSEELFRFLENEVSPALFATTDIGLPAFPAPVSPTDYLQAALDGEWPCDHLEPFPSPGCEMSLFSLMLEES